MARYDSYDPAAELASHAVPIHRALTTPVLWFGVERAWGMVAMAVGLLVMLASAGNAFVYLVVAPLAVLAVMALLRRLSAGDPYRIRHYLRATLLRPARLAGRAPRRRRSPPHVWRPRWRAL